MIFTGISQEIDFHKNLTGGPGLAPSNYYNRAASVTSATTANTSEPVASTSNAMECPSVQVSNVHCVIRNLTFKTKRGLSNYERATLHHTNLMICLPDYTFKNNNIVYEVRKFTSAFNNTIENIRIKPTKNAVVDELPNMFIFLTNIEDHVASILASRMYHSNKNNVKFYAAVRAMLVKPESKEENEEKICMFKASVTNVYSGDHVVEKVQDNTNKKSRNLITLMLLILGGLWEKF